MKKTLAFALVAVALFGFAAGAGAQGMEIGTKLGYGGLTDDPSEAFDDAFAGGLYLNYHFNPIFALQGSWLYSKHDQSDELNAVTDFLASVELGVPADADIRLAMHQMDLNGLFKFSSGSVTPYVLVGLGLNYWTVEGKVIVAGLSATEDESFWDWEANIGGGINFAMTETVRLGAEFVYTYVFDEFDAGIYSVVGTLSYAFGPTM